MTEEELNDPQRTIDQLRRNQQWLIDRIDEIHRALCPGKYGTWQQRAEQAVAAAKKSASNNLP